MNTISIKFNFFSGTFQGCLPGSWPLDQNPVGTTVIVLLLDKCQFKLIILIVIEKTLCGNHNNKRTLTTFDSMRNLYSCISQSNTTGISPGQFV